jgi:phytoene dehydrogenase-like protein
METMTGRTKASYDAIIIGAGHNGLVTAAYLARAGQRVLVVEQRPVLGGSAATEALLPGYQVNSGAHDARLLLPQVVADLGLRQHGLEFIESAVTVLAPQPDGRALTLYRDLARSQAAIAEFSRADAEKYPTFLELANRLIDELAGVLTLTPPDLGTLKPGELLPWARLALDARRLGKHDMMELLRVLPMTAAEFLNEWFESDALKGVLGAASVIGGPWGPMASGTSFMLLYQRLGAAGGHQFVRGGLGQLSEALAKVASAHGAEIRTGCAVTGILLADDGANGAATGVTLADGETLNARVVVSGADPRRTLFGLVGAPNLEPRFMRQVRNIRFRGSTAKVVLGLNGLPRFAGSPNDAECLGGHVLVSPSLDYLERAADDGKYGRLSERPMLDAVLPTVLDPSLAPTGQHLMTITVQWAPYHLREGDWDAQREALGERVIATLAQYAPGFRELVVRRRVITPLDWERDYGLTEGSIFHGEMGLDQLLFMRPVPGFGQYRTPIARLYLCGAGTHPGGGVTGAPGYNAAREILKDLKR